MLLLTASLAAVMTANAAAGDDETPPAPQWTPTQTQRAADLRNEPLPRRMTADASIQQAPLPKTPGAKAPLPKVSKKPASGSSIPKDEPYTPRGMDFARFDLTESPETETEFRIIRHSLEEIPAYRDEPVVLTQYSWIDQRMFGPVAPFPFLPTYFEDPCLTRYGYTCSEHLQPFISGGEFLLSVPLLPYQMQRRHPWIPVYPNYCPPCSCVEKFGSYFSGITADAIVMEAACVAVAILVIP